MRKSYYMLFFVVFFFFGIQAQEWANPEQIPQSLRWDLFFRPWPLLFFMGSIVLTVLAWLLWKKRNRKDFIPGPKALGSTTPKLKQFYAWVPVILGIHAAIALLFYGIHGQLFSSAPLKNGWVNWIGLVEIFIALSLFYGGLTRLSAILLGSLWILGVDILGLRPMLESLQYLGLAIFFYLVGRGPYAMDRLLFPDLEPTPKYETYALPILRFCVGFNLVIFGFTQKLANIPYALSTLHPYVQQPLGNEFYVLFAGAMEILAGLLIAFGIFPRTIILASLIPINASLTVANWNDLVDFLPMYGALAVLLIWEPTAYHQNLWLEALQKPPSENESHPEKT